MSDVVERLRRIVGPGAVCTGSEIHDDVTHDETLGTLPVTPLAVVFPSSTGEVSEALRLCNELDVPVIVRGSGTGLSGAAVPVPDGIVMAFDHMTEIVEIDLNNHVAVVQPGVSLQQLDAALAPVGLVYPVFPGEMTASLGGNVATNAGGMRAVRYGVTRHNVLGLQAVLADGEVIRTGGKFVKSSSGYDLTQLIIGSEGTLAVVTEATVKLYPRMAHSVTLLAPFATLREITEAVPKVVGSGIGPTILEYLDVITMDGITASAGVDLGIPDDIRSTTLAYLVVVLESTHDSRLEDDADQLANQLSELGALDVYVLPPTAGAQLIEARERSFFVAKASGVDDIVDAVIPRAAMPDYLSEVGDLAAEHGALVVGCGHVGDGNVHLAVFQPDAQQRHQLLREIFAACVRLGGAISGEHGIGTAKRDYFLEHEDPAKLALMRRIKAAFDPNGILGPGRIVGIPAARAAGSDATVGSGPGGAVLGQVGGGAR